MIVNGTAAARYFPGEDAVGRSIAIGGRKSALREIVGVVADITDGPPEAPPSPAMYVPFDQPAFTIVVRTARADGSVLRTLVAALRRDEPGLLVTGASTMSERLQRLPSATFKRVAAWLVGGFAAVAFLLSVAGLYGVVAYTVAQRRRVIGVRMALGAKRRSVYGLVMRDAGRLVAIGTVLGSATGIGAALLIREHFFGIAAWDPRTLLAAASVLVVAALAACLVPARRAVPIDPVDVLRAE